MRPVTVVIFFLGIFAGIAAPIFRRYGKAGMVLAGGAAMLMIVAVCQDMRRLATVAANRCAYRLVLECEKPLLALALAVARLAAEDAYLGRLGDSTLFYDVRINAWLNHRRAGLRKKEQRHKVAANGRGRTRLRRWYS